MHEMMFVCKKGKAETWLCLDCGRQVEIVWTPFSHKVIEKGSETGIPHNVSKKTWLGEFSVDAGIK